MQNTCCLNILIGRAMMEIVLKNLRKRIILKFALLQRMYQNSDTTKGLMFHTVRNRDLISFSFMNMHIKASTTPIKISLHKYLLVVILEEKKTLHPRAFSEGKVNATNLLYGVNIIVILDLYKLLDIGLGVT